MQRYNVIGLMSGTSLDGLDIAYCRFEFSEKWTFKILQTTTISYSKDWKNRLMQLETQSALEFVKTHVDLGHYFGKLVNDFIQKYKIGVDLIASHGHTIFHQPEKGFTFQIGDGNAIAAKVGLPVVFDFRSLDVALDGQGAPLVPIGDKLLFHDYDFCLNLGGIANISFCNAGERIAFDISPCNMALNDLAERLGLTYDVNGANARKGVLNTELLNVLNNLEYYKQPFPKSLGKEWYLQFFKPILDSFQISIFDKLRTVTEHIAFNISQSVSAKTKEGKILVTGGGVFNQFLTERIQGLLSIPLVIPSNELINFKEALIFAFLGVLRVRNEANCLPSVTGARKACYGGSLVN